MAGELLGRVTNTYLPTRCYAGGSACIKRLKASSSRILCRTARRCLVFSGALNCSLHSALTGALGRALGCMVLSRLAPPRVFGRWSAFTAGASQSSAAAIHCPSIPLSSRERRPAADRAATKSHKFSNRRHSGRLRRSVGQLEAP